MHVGFTGTKNGMTKIQSERVEDLLSFYKKDKGGEYSLFHHGDCYGADEEAHVIADVMGWKVCIHPPEDNRFRAYLDGKITMSPLPYLERNSAIVQHSSILIAAPSQLAEVLRSGTWATIRRARNAGKTVRIVYVNGTSERK